MNPFRRIVAVVLLMLWGTATVHCGLEIDGLFGAPTHGSQAATDGGDQDLDGCAAIEGGLFAADGNFLNVAQPAFLVEFVLHDFEPIPTAIAGVTGEPSAHPPPELLPTWHFKRRTSPPSHAPDFFA